MSCFFKKHGLTMNLDKTDVMWIGKQREELNIRLDGRDIMQVNNFVYHGGNISENGRVFLVWFVFFFSVQGSVFQPHRRTSGEFRVGDGVHDSYTFQCGLDFLRPLA